MLFQIGKTELQDLPAKVAKAIGPGPEHRGQIKFRGGWWTAQCEQPHVTLSPGQMCRVVGRESIILLVEPVPSNAS